MSARWNEWLIRLYPRAWRERYQEEMLALLEQRPPTARDRLDILRGACDAHLRGDLVLGRGMPVSRRMRLSEIAILCGFVLFGVGYLGLQRLRDPLLSWDVAATAHPELSVLFDIAQIAGLLSLLALVAGGTPVVLSALKQAWHEQRRDVLALFGVAAALGVCFLAYSGLAFTITNARPGQGIRPLRPVDDLLTLTWLGLFGLCLVAIPTCAALAVVRGPISERVVRFALLPGAVVAGAMALACAGTAALGAVIYAEAPTLITGPITQDIGWHLLLAIVMLMLAGTLVAARALVLGFRARTA
jgi:hypothetical protein